MKRVKKTLVIVVIAVLAAAGGWYWWQRSKKKETPVPLTTVKVEKGSIRLSVASTGRVIANLDVDIKCKASGEVITLPYDVSDSVKKGDLLVELDPVDEDRILKQAEVSLSASRAKLVIARQNLDISSRTLVTDRKRAEAALKSAQARAADAKAKAERKKQLLDKGLGTQEDYETAQTTAIQAQVDLEYAQIKLEELRTQELSLELERQNVKLAEAAVESDNIARSIAWDRLVDTKVTAPMDGVVAARNVQTGQIIASGVSNIGGGTTVLTLSDLSRVFILAAVDESDIGKVTVGQAATIRADAFPSTVWEGKVIRIATRGVNVSNVVTFEVKIEVLGERKSLLKPEMTTNVEITSTEKNNVLLVPVEAVTRKGAKTFVSLSKGDNVAEERPVTIGVTDGVKAEVVAGLAEGDTVVFRKGGLESRSNAGQSSSRNRPGPPPPF